MNNLKYLFTAELKDGSIYKQNKLDASVKFPPVKDENGELQGHSCTSDIQEDIDNCNIKRFTLVEQKLIAGNIVSVDLTDGHFEINGIPFDVEGDRPLPTKSTRFKLIFYRIRRQHRVTPAGYVEPQKITKNKDGSVDVINSAGQLHHYAKVVKIWKQTDPIEDDKGNVIKYVDRTYLQPEAPLPELQYMIGWQTTIAGKNFQQVVLVG